MLDAGKIFDHNHANFSTEAGTPESAETFRKAYITPVFERNRSEGMAIESAYGEVIADYQRDGFIVGFNAAVQLLTNCMSGNAARG